MSEWRSFSGPTELDKALADHLARRLESDLARRGHASLAVSGGSTPTGMFRQLSNYPLDWNKVWLTLVDERCVPSDSPDSNERLLRENLMQNRAANAHFVNLGDTATQSPAPADPDFLAMPRPFSAVVLGMGGDGHTASWFPRATNLKALLDPANPQQVAETDPVTAPHRRLTLTLAAVLDSGEIIVHITGETKREVLESAREQRHPVAAVLDQTTTPVTIWWAPQ